MHFQYTNNLTTEMLQQWSRELATVGLKVVSITGALKTLRQAHYAANVYSEATDASMSIMRVSLCNRSGLLVGTAMLARMKTA